jgi:hypothetical protein
MYVWRSKRVLCDDQPRNSTMRLQQAWVFASCMLILRALGQSEWFQCNLKGCHSFALNSI